MARANSSTPLQVSTVWALENVVGYWDELALRCRQVVNGKEVLYQKGKLARLMAPKELMAFIRSKIGAPLDGTIMFSGTWPPSTRSTLTSL